MHAESAEREVIGVVKRGGFLAHRTWHLSCWFTNAACGRSQSADNPAR